MNRLVFLVVLLVLVGLFGCTPIGDGVLRKESADRPVGAGLAIPLSGQAVEPISLPVLDASTKRMISEYGPLIKACGREYGFDWRLILAMIKQESRYVPDAVSEKGAQGLMQIMPVTGEEVARDLSIKDITHPESNIRGGVFYLRRLYDFFDEAEDVERLKLALAAYNAGLGRVYDAQDVAAYLLDDPEKWESVKTAMPLLSKRFWTLHRNIWSEEKPRTGWFGDGGETIAYVERVIEYYDEFRLLLN